MKNLNTIITFVLIFSILVSCKANKQEIPTVLDYMCGKLCWNNIVVGTTTIEELLSVLSNLPNVDQSSISEFRPAGLFDERIYFSFYNNPSDEGTVVRVSAYLIDQKVVALELDDNLGATFQGVTSDLGEPDLVSTIKNQGGQVDISFINSSNGISFGYVAQSEKLKIHPQTKILTLTFFDPALYQELLEADWLLPGYSERNLYPWIGYGKIEEHYWPPRKP